jgi:hypothetical protein
VLPAGLQEVVVHKTRLAELYGQRCLLFLVGAQPVLEGFSYQHG